MSKAKASNKSKKSRKASRNLSDEEYWGKWSERFGKKMEKKGKAFGGEMEARFEKKDGIWEKKWRNSFCVFGVFGPFIKAVVGLIFLMLGIVILNLINWGLGSTFVAALAGFLSTNISWIFLVSLLLGYGRFLLKVMGKRKWILSPIVGSAKASFVLWFLANIFLAINISAKVWFFDWIANAVLANLLLIFLVLAVIGYLMVIMMKFLRSAGRCRPGRY
jgi:hypothetical protein